MLFLSPLEEHDAQKGTKDVFTELLSVVSKTALATLPKHKTNIFDA
jgi:hypothetical protein